MVFEPAWGKSRPGAGGAAGWHLLPYHSLDVAAVGVAALQRAPAMRSLFTDRLGVNETQVVRRIAFWLALHDLG
jgi:CRISPR-associated endonuclease/helicase Cas3